MEYLIGLASGIVLFALLGASFYAGTRHNKPVREAPKPLTNDERIEAERLKKGFNQLMNYSEEKARGSIIE